MIEDTNCFNVKLTMHDLVLHRRWGPVFPDTNAGRRCSPRRHYTRIPLYGYDSNSFCLLINTKKSTVWHLRLVYYSENLPTQPSPNNQVFHNHTDPILVWLDLLRSDLKGTGRATKRYRSRKCIPSNCTTSTPVSSLIGFSLVSRSLLRCTL